MESTWSGIDMELTVERKQYNIKSDIFRALFVSCHNEFVAGSLYFDFLFQMEGWSTALLVALSVLLQVTINNSLFIMVQNFKWLKETRTRRSATETLEIPYDMNSLYANIL